MKKILIPVLALLLIATMLVACKKEAQQPAKKGTDVSVYKSQGTYTDLGNDKKEYDTYGVKRGQSVLYNSFKV